MNESVVFDYLDFQSFFPEFTGNESSATTAFWLAEGIVNNTPNSYVEEKCLRKKLLYLLTAHILTLESRGMNNIGQIGGAHEGSVGVDYSTASIDKLNAGWFGQTQYGLMFWQLSAKFRSGFFVP